MGYSENYGIRIFFWGALQSGDSEKIRRETQKQADIQRTAWARNLYPCTVFLERSEAYHSLGLTTATANLDSNVSVIPSTTV